MDADLLIPFLFLGFAFAAAILALFAWLDGRQTSQALREILTAVTDIKTRGDSAERQIRNEIREEMKTLRGETEDRASRLRFELGQLMTGSGESLQNRVGDMSRTVEERLTAFETLQKSDAVALRLDLGENMKRSDDHVRAASEEQAKTQRERLDAMSAKLGELTERLDRQQAAFGDRLGLSLKAVTDQLAELLKANDARQTQLRDTLTQNLETLRKDNEAKLEQMRLTVDEKLQGTLEKRLGESFLIVSERLDKVHQGLGEMQTLATGVGDLKRVLTNVKSRGGWAEVQLGALLENMLSPEQYEKNARIKPSTQELVEFAIRMPGGEEGRPVLLPLDAKFPHEDYDRLQRAQDAGNPVEIEAAAVQLAAVIRNEAKRISDKYIDPPATTDFAIMYLPTEGLFAEAVRRDGLLVELQQKYKVTVAGPTTLSAFLNSLQMGFRTLAVQKRSSEVWKVLGEAKSEFEKYALVWDRLQKQLDTAQRTVAEAGTRSKAVARKLRNVQSLDPGAPALDALSDVTDWEDDQASFPAGPATPAKIA
jgi:DNA recombination protein RmuC